MTARVPHPADIDPFDLVDGTRFAARGYPHDVWTRLRAEAPVCWFEPAGWQPFWAVTRHADIQQVAKQPNRFSNEHGLIIMPEGAPMQPAEMVVTIDPPRHGPLRGVAIRRFTPRAVRARARRDRAHHDRDPRRRRRVRSGRRVRLRREGRRAAADRGDLLDPRRASGGLAAALPLDQRGDRQGRPRVPPSGGVAGPDDPPGPGRAARVPPGAHRRAAGRPPRRHRQPPDRRRDRRRAAHRGAAPQLLRAHGRGGQRDHPQRDQRRSARVLASTPTSGRRCRPGPSCCPTRSRRSCAG